jgi:hypothetical protein
VSCRSPLGSNRQGGGHWFEPSIAHRRTLVRGSGHDRKYQASTGNPPGQPRTWPDRSGQRLQGLSDLGPANRRKVDGKSRVDRRKIGGRRDHLTRHLREPFPPNSGLPATTSTPAGSWHGTARGGMGRPVLARGEFAGDRVQDRSEIAVVDADYDRAARMRLSGLCPAACDHGKSLMSNDSSQTIRR